MTEMTTDELYREDVAFGREQHKIFELAREEEREFHKQVLERLDRLVAATRPSIVLVGISTEQVEDVVVDVAWGLTRGVDYAESSQDVRRGREGARVSSPFPPPLLTTQNGRVRC